MIRPGIFVGGSNNDMDIWRDRQSVRKMAALLAEPVARGRPIPERGDVSPEGQDASNGIAIVRPDACGYGESVLLNEAGIAARRRRPLSISCPSEGLTSGSWWFRHRC